MKPLRFIAATLAAGLCAVGLSVGAALAEGPHDAAAAAKRGAHYTPKGVCLLLEQPKR